VTDLLEVARRLVRAARQNEQIEAYVLRSSNTHVRVFDGDVESLSVAEIDGIGVRVITEGRQGYAWAGSLDPLIVDDALADARDNAGFGAVDEHYGLPTQADCDGVTSAELDVFREELLTAATDDKVALALDTERATRAADPRIRGVEFSGYADAAVETAVANSLGVEAATRRTTCSCSAFAMAGDSAATQTGYGFTAGRAPSDLDVVAAGRDAAVRATRLLGATQPSSRRFPVLLDPLVSAALLGIVGAALGGESVLKGRSMFAGREGEDVS